eukprot:403368397
MKIQNDKQWSDKIYQQSASSQTNLIKNGQQEIEKTNQDPKGFQSLTDDNFSILLQETIQEIKNNHQEILRQNILKDQDLIDSLQNQTASYKNKESMLNIYKSSDSLPELRVSEQQDRAPIQYYCMDDEDEPLYDSNLLLNTHCDNFYVPQILDTDENHNIDQFHRFSIKQLAPSNVNQNNNTTKDE